MDKEKIATMSPRDLLHVVFKRKIQILVFFGATVSIVAVASFMATPTYEATAQLLVKVGMEAVYAPVLPMGDTQPIVRVSRQEQINSEIEILRSRFLAEKVMESLGPEGLYKDSDNTSEGGSLGRLFHTADATQSPAQNSVSSTQTAIDTLQQSTVVEPVTDSNVITVRFRHSDPELAAKVANTLVKVYLDRHLQVYQNPQSSAFLGKQYQILQDELKQAEENLNNFKKEHDLISLQEERSLLLTQEANLRTALNQTLSEEAEMQNRLQNPVPDARLHERLVELELKEHELLTKYTDESRLVQGIRNEIEMLHQKLAEQASTEMNALRARKHTQLGQLADYQKRLEELNQIETEFNKFQQEVEVDRQNARLYLGKFKESRLSNAIEADKTATAAIIEPASPPLRPVSPKIRLNMILATFLGGIGAFGLAFFSEYLGDSLETAEDVENHLDVPVLASIPESKT